VFAFLAANGQNNKKSTIQGSAEFVIKPKAEALKNLLRLERGPCRCIRKSGETKRFLNPLQVRPRPAPDAAKGSPWPHKKSGKVFV